MELNWSTFVLEIINFLVLVWILKRFLYKPVLAGIARRRAGIEKTCQDAEALAGRGRACRNIRAAPAEWEQERQQARDDLEQELEAERAAAAGRLQPASSRNGRKAAVAESMRQTSTSASRKRQALTQGARFRHPAAGPAGRTGTGEQAARSGARGAAACRTGAAEICAAADGKQTRGSVGAPAPSRSRRDQRQQARTGAAAMSPCADMRQFDRGRRAAGRACGSRSAPGYLRANLQDELQLRRAGHGDD